MEESPPQRSLAWKEIISEKKMEIKIICKYLAKYQGRCKVIPAEVAELDESKTDNNLKQHLHKLGTGVIIGL